MLLILVVAGVAAVVTVVSLREPGGPPPRGGRDRATEVVVAPSAPVPAKQPPSAPRPAPTEEPLRKAPAKEKGPGAPETVAVPTPALTPQEKSDWARRIAASAEVIRKSRSKREREQLERHVRRFLGHGAVPPGNWVDPKLQALQAGAGAKAELLPIPEPDEAEKRRIEQLEKLRQRQAVGLLDHIHGGLAWLALHQAPDGRFSDPATAARCKELGHAPPCIGRNKRQYEVACTAFAIMALLDFRDQDVRGLFEPSLAAAVRWLHGQQRRDGAFPGRRQLYTNAIALMALAQAAESTGDGKLRASVRRGLELFASRPGPVGGYRYAFGSPGDLSVTGWVAQAVEMARRAGVEIPPMLEPGLRDFLDSVWLGGYRFSYLTRAIDRPSLYPVGMLMGRILWPDPHPAILASWRQWLAKGARNANLYTLYYGVRVVIALEEDLTDPWRKWVFALAKTQLRKGPAAGRFGGRRGWLGVAGDTLHTAVAVLTLEHALYLR